MFPKIKPYAEGYIKVSPMHTLHYEQVGNPTGKPVIFLHGGPGVGIMPDYRRLFDPEFYRIILLDQRGSGKSTPFAELKQNNTWELVEDLEKLRKQLKIKTWLVSGGSWGSTLALCYAIKHPRSIKAIIIRGIFLGEKSEIDWLFSPNQGASQIWPDEYEKFISILPKGKNKFPLKEYYKLLTSKDKKTQLKASHFFAGWESTIMNLVPSKALSNEIANTEKELSFARTECYFSLKNYFMPYKNFVLKNASKMKKIPMKIVQGRYDTICPVISAYKLHKALPKSELIIVPTGSHNPSEAPMASALIKAQQDFKKLY